MHTNGFSLGANTIRIEDFGSFLYVTDTDTPLPSDLWVVYLTTLANGTLDLAEDGTLTISGDCDQQSAGLLEIEISGPAPGVDYDGLHMHGDVWLDGLLEVDLIDPMANDIPPQISRQMIRQGCFDLRGDGGRHIRRRRS